ncbi:MAG: glycosyltransferase family 4 protein [Kofleriaceae bacterium]|nr:glycosyltransferase family 4 protein [Kofleriaceae bacterium]
MTVVNQMVADSELLASLFDVEVLPLAFARSFEDLDRMSVRKLVRTMMTAVRLVHVLVVRRPDAVYFTLAPAGAAFYRDCMLVAIMKVAGVPRIYHLHGKVTRARHALHRWAFDGAWLIHLSERLTSGLPNVVPRERVLVVPNGVADQEPIDRTPRRGRVRLLFLSNVTETKGPMVLIAALGMLHAAGIPFEATIAGAVHDQRFLELCKGEIRRHRLHKLVHYVGPAYGERKQRLFEAHDVFVLPTRRDAFPLVALEAMQAGLPVVTTREGALPEIVEVGKTGFLVPPGDPVSLAKCLAALVPDRALQRQLGANGRARYLAKYTQAEFERNLADALVTCMDASSLESRAVRPRTIPLAGGEL